MAKSERDSLRQRRKAQARLDREEFFARPGAQAIGWMGGRSSVEGDRRKEADRQACRMRQEVE